jgi:hypothetical protein
LKISGRAPATLPDSQSWKVTTLNRSSEFDWIVVAGMYEVKQRIDEVLVQVQA